MQDVAALFPNASGARDHIADLAYKAYFATDPEKHAQIINSLASKG